MNSQQELQTVNSKNNLNSANFGMEQEKFKHYYAGYSKEGPNGKVAGSRLLRNEEGGSNSP